MIPNNHPGLSQRFAQLLLAIKLVYASTYCESARAYVKSTFHRTEDEKMGVIIQQLTGEAYGIFFYPAISGVAQSYNYYPISYMKPEDGLAHVALGLGKIVVEGGTALRFSPKYPQFLPQFSTVDDILENSQRFFYALNTAGFPDDLAANEDATLQKLDIEEAINDTPVRHLCSTYSAEDHRIRDGVQASGYPVCTFASILKSADKAWAAPWRSNLPLTPRLMRIRSPRLNCCKSGPWRLINIIWKLKSVMKIFPKPSVIPAWPSETDNLRKLKILFL
jgi:hypothetical protein